MNRTKPEVKSWYRCGRFGGGRSVCRLPSTRVFRAGIQHVALAVCLATVAGCARLTARANPEAGFEPVVSDQAKAYAHYCDGVLNMRAEQRLAAIQRRLLVRNNKVKPSPVIELLMACARARARDAFRNVTELDPDAFRPYVMLGELSIRTGDFEGALDAYRHAVELVPDAFPSLMVIGQLSLKMGDTDGAMKAFRRAIEVAPDSVAARLELVKTLESANDLVESIKIYEKLVELRPENPLLHHQLGVAYLRIDRLDEAREALERSIEKVPDYLDAWFALGIIYQEKEEFEKSAEHFERVVTGRPGDASVRRALGAVYARLLRWDEAETQFEKLAGLPGKGQAGNRDLAFLHVLSDRLEEAEAVAGRLLAQGSNSAVDVAILGLCLVAKGETQTGLDRLGEIRSERIADSRSGDQNIEDTSGAIDNIHTYVLDDQALDDLVDRLAFFGKEEISRKLAALFEEAEREGLTGAPIHNIHGKCLEIAGEYDTAAKLYKKAVVVEPDNKLAYFSLGALYEEMERYEDAAQQLERALELDPNDPTTCNYLGYLWAEQNMRLDEAEKLIKRALANDPENGFYLDSLGWVYYKQGRFEDALRYLRDALFNLDQDDAVVRDHIGDTYFQLGDVEKAMVEWKKALVLDPDVKGVSEKLAEQETP